ncbi:ABC transporter ATP-binding protein [Clostridium sp. DJ247]|uniref:ABC transporter ATP-binding protein n=1 Tax=Clostridium sp. DJ247 TaxID=2726188 RepID=UPI001625A839|nr:ABC transporter ATP-binding protein [Clostridium sp. DJ247]MBC2578746.1 ABC transporter ATP-binding protein [Clostridium sp. DJ247]
MSTEIVNVSKYFDDFKALDNINLTIDQGEFIAILGPSGCGKTTLLRLIAGFDFPSQGEIKINGELVSSSKKFLSPDKRNIGMVFQSFALWPHMTVKEHLYFPLKYHGFVSKKLKNEREKLVNETLNIIGLNYFSDRLPGQLSGGQKQRVALARAIIARPSLLLMDEPLSALDAELKIEMRREIQNIHRLTKTAIVYVTHDQSEALAMADRIVIMKNGKIEQIGSPKDIYLNPRTEFVATFVSKANLIKGEWKDNIFCINVGTKLIQWNDDGVSQEIKNKNLYNVRPEQLKLSREEEGIPGVIRNVQYQGKETHYNVEVLNQLITVYDTGFNNYILGEKINILKNKAEFQN